MNDDLLRSWYNGLLENGAQYLSLGVSGSNHLLAAGTELTHAQATVEIWCVLVAARSPVQCSGKQDKPLDCLSLKPQADDLTDQGL